MPGEHLSLLSEPPRSIVVAPARRWSEAQRDRHRVARAPDHLTIVVGGASRAGNRGSGVSPPSAEGAGGVLIHDAARARIPGSPSSARHRVAVRGCRVGVIPHACRSSTRIARTTVGVSGWARSPLRARDDPGRQTRIPRSLRPTGLPAAMAGPAGTPTMPPCMPPPGIPSSNRRGRRGRVQGDHALGTFVAPNCCSLGGARRSAPGVGIDVQRLRRRSAAVAGRPVTGLTKPGLAGHSDGDAISHAICDAMLLRRRTRRHRLALRRRRPPDSRISLGVRSFSPQPSLSCAGCRVPRPSSTSPCRSFAARPRFAARRHEVEALLFTRWARCTVSVAATTSDGLGFTGPPGRLTAVATALLHS